MANGSGHSRLLRKSCCTRSGPRRRLCPLARPCTSTSCCHTRKSAAKNEHRALFVMLRRACVRACVPCMLFVVEGERGEYRGGFAAAGGAGGIGGTLSEPRFDTRVVRDLRWRLAGVAHDALIRLVNAVAGPCCLRKCIRARQLEGVLSTTREQERAHTGSGMRECGDQFCARARAWRAGRQTLSRWSAQRAPTVPLSNIMRPGEHQPTGTANILTGLAPVRATGIMKMRLRRQDEALAIRADYFVRGQRYARVAYHKTASRYSPCTRYATGSYPAQQRGQAAPTRRPRPRRRWDRSWPSWSICVVARGCGLFLVVVCSQAASTACPPGARRCDSLHSPCQVLGERLLSSGHNIVVFSRHLYQNFVGGFLRLYCFRS